MTQVDVTVHCPVHDSFRVQQVAGIFDVPLSEQCRQRFRVEMPGPDEAWQVGVIVGPSGSGKTTIAREVFGDCLYADAVWPSNKAVVDGFGERPIREITRALTAVGFSSPPSWIKPYSVLSGGEQFRCNLARALLSRRSTVAFDEFTSVVDRTVARVGSAAVSRAIRSGKIARRFVAITCHYDVLEWLEPDWVADMATGELARSRLRRPAVRIEIFRCRHDAWRLFAKHHYLNAGLNRSAQCFLATWEGRPVGFCATLPLIARKGRRRISRVVVLPDYQGISIGTRLAEAVAEIHRDEGLRCNITASHPAVLRHCSRSPLWRTVGVRQVRSKSYRLERSMRYHASQGRLVVSFEYVGERTRAAEKDCAAQGKESFADACG